MTDDDRAIWQLLLAEATIPDVKASPIGWAAWSHAHPTAGGRIVVARDGGRPVAIAALAPDHLAWRGLHARRIASAGDLHWRCGYPVTSRDVRRAIGALLDELTRTGGWDVLALGPMLTDSPALAALVDVGTARGLHPVVGAAGRAPRVVIAGDWAGYYRSRSAKLRATVTSGERRLASRGRLALEEHRGGPDLDAALDAFYRIEASGWKGTEGSAIACDPVLRGFYDRLAAEAAARGQLRLFLLRAGDTVIAGDYALEHGGGVYLLKTAYDASWARGSPGQVLRKRVLAHLWSTGDVRAYDLMSGGGSHGDYKLRWANDVRAYAEVRLFHPRTVRGRALGGLVRIRHAVDEPPPDAPRLNCQSRAPALPSWSRSR